MLDINIVEGPNGVVVTDLQGSVLQTADSQEAMIAHLLGERVDLIKLQLEGLVLLEDASSGLKKIRDLFRSLLSADDDEGFAQTTLSATHRAAIVVMVGEK